MPPTKTRCFQFCPFMGVRGVCVTKTRSGFVQQHQVSLRHTKDPIGKENDAWVHEMAKGVAITVAAWGNPMENS
ncbi:MAG: hypothetical protein Ct9H300mP28_00020 [Pseudomonadota bacterium]|nr:MAG: hypothetical protein Ct9H300mP28_00020 [Pseudomonadota bacterium]